MTSISPSGAEKACPLDTSRVNNYLRTISSMSLTNYVTCNATDEELRTYAWIPLS